MAIKMLAPTENMRKNLFVRLGVCISIFIGRYITEYTAAEISTFT